MGTVPGNGSSSSSNALSLCRNGVRDVIRDNMQDRSIWEDTAVAEQ